MHPLAPSSLAVLFVLVGCGSGEPGPKTDEGKTPAQIQQVAQSADVPVLQKVVASYEGAIASLAGERDDLQLQIEELAKQAGGKALDGLLGGEGKGDEVAAQVTELKARVDEIVTEITQLKEKLAVYVKELSSRPGSA